MISDGKLPNIYWVSISNDYNYIHDGSVDWIGDLIPSFKSKGKTFPKGFQSYKDAKGFCDWALGLQIDGITVNRINIEDRLTGELYEKTMIFNPQTGQSVEDEWEDIGFSVRREAELKQLA
jgi:hypothetical protein